MNGDGGILPCTSIWGGLIGQVCCRVSSLKFSFELDFSISCFWLCFNLSTFIWSILCTYTADQRNEVTFTSAGMLCARWHLAAVVGAAGSLFCCSQGDGCQCWQWNPRLQYARFHLLNLWQHRLRKCEAYETICVWNHQSLELLVVVMQP